MTCTMCSYIRISLILLSLFLLQGCKVQSSPGKVLASPPVVVAPRSLPDLLELLTGSSPSGEKFEAALELGRIGTVQRDQEVMSYVASKELTDPVLIATSLRHPQTERAKDALVDLFRKEDSAICSEIARTFKTLGNQQRINTLLRLNESKSEQTRQSVELILGTRRIE